MVEQQSVQHHPQSQQFTIATGGEAAVLAYELKQDATGTTVDFYRTYVPAAYRQQGLAEKLVRAGLAWARAQQYTVDASCWYVQKFLRR